jgi:hypothetical protein
MSNSENINFTEINKRMKIVNNSKDAEATSDALDSYINSGELTILEEEYAKYCWEEKKVLDFTHKVSRLTTKSLTYVLAASASAVVTAVIKEQAKDLAPYQSKFGRAVLFLGEIGVYSAVYGVAHQQVHKNCEVPPEKINAKCVAKLNKSRKKAGLPPIDGTLPN